jgi:redox-sensitive bicupin YhaK (pirin superfamily)
MDKRPRIDLDGVTLSDPEGPAAAVAIFRYRTVEGLVLSMPESADIVVPWSDVEAADLSLAHGKLTVAFTERFASAANWLGGVRKLEGRWTDRVTLRSADLERADVETR